MKMVSLKREKQLRDNATWVPQPIQEFALSRPEFEIGLGGARGGGKSDTGAAWTGYDSEYPFQGLIVRKNSTDLEGFLMRLKQVYPKILVTGKPSIVKFPGHDGTAGKGATYFTGHLKDQKAIDKYVGQNLMRIMIEELNLIPSEERYLRLLTSCRSTIPGLKPQVFTTFNSDNVGHSWLKKRFRLSGIPKHPVITKDERSGRMRIFIPATVEDNPILMKNDPQYVRSLEGLPDGIREQWRWGSWDDPIIQGAYYTLELNQMRRENRITDLAFRPQLSVHTWWDIGADTTAILFVQFVDDWIHIIDFYLNDSVGFPFYLKKLQELREQRGYRYGVHHFPHDFNKLEWGSGNNRREVAETANLDYEIVPRVTVKQDSIDQSRLIFPLLKIDQHKCAQLVDALTNYRKEWLEEKQTYTDKPVHDWASHPADALQGLAMTNIEGIKLLHAPSMQAKAEVDEMNAPRKKSLEFGPREPDMPKTRFHHD